MESILQDINKNLISMSDAEITRTKRILASVLETFIANMKNVDPLFNARFSRVFYGGSFYDGLKVCSPDEFDLDLLLKLPKKTRPTLTTSNIPGFVHLQLQDLDTWLKQPEAKSNAYKNFEKLLLDDKRYLNTQKVLSWMESVVFKAINQLPVDGKKRILTNGEGIFEITVHKGGPALTLHIRGAGIKMDVDLVACFVFPGDMWPKNGFRANPVYSRPEFFIVPKKPKAPADQPILRYWRLSFQEQERVLINSKERLKPTVRLLKKLRDTLQHKCIASYYIKTVVLDLVDKKNPSFWNNSLSHVFMTVLKDYKLYIENKKIPYYWNTKNNLLGGIDARTLDNISNRLGYVIKDMENNLDMVPKYFECNWGTGGETVVTTNEADSSSWCSIS